MCVRANEKGRERGGNFLGDKLTFCNSGEDGKKGRGEEGKKRRREEGKRGSKENKFHMAVCFVLLACAHDYKVKNFFQHAQESTKYDELENTKLSVCRVAYLMESSVRNFLLLRAEEYNI